MIYEMMKNQEACLYASCDSPVTMKIMYERRSNDIPKVKKVIWNNDACVVIWKDDTKTVVKCQEGDMWNKEVGLMAAFSKKLFGNDNTFNKIINRYCSDFFNEDERIQKALEKLNKCFYEAMEEDDEDDDKKKRLTRATYLSGDLELRSYVFMSFDFVLPQYARDFIQLANKNFDECLKHFNLELSVIKTKDNTFKIVLVEKKGEEDEV